MKVFCNFVLLIFYTLNSTIENFKYKDSLIKEYDNWVVLLRPKQVTLGSLVIICKEGVESMSLMSEESSSEFFVVVRELESVMESVFKYDKINYLALMMVDKHVHFHVLPRYSKPVLFKGVTYQDVNWPTAPDLSEVVEFDKEDLNELRLVISKHFLKC